MKPSPSMPAHRATKEERARAQADASRAALQAVADLGLDQDDVADALAIGQSHVSRALSSKRSKNLTLADLRLLSRRLPELAVRLASWALRPTDAEVIAVPTEGSIEELLRALAEAQKEHSEAQTHSMQACADQVITRAEAQGGAEEHREAGVRHLAIARAYDKLAETSAVVKLPRRVG